MLGGIIGDIIGSQYETGWMQSENFEIDWIRSNFTDETVMITAIADALVNKLEYFDAIKKWYNKYSYVGYGRQFKYFMRFGEPNDSFGSLSSSRSIPIGWHFENIDDVLLEAEKQSIVSHNHPEAIYGAKAIAACVFFAKKGYSKENIVSQLKELNLSYAIFNIETLEDVRKKLCYSTRAIYTVPYAIYVFLKSSNFEDCIRKAISLGGDSDTIACMAGGIAEAYYKRIPYDYIFQTKNKIPEDIYDIIKVFGSVHNSVSF